jgi:hypothetical protein
MGREGGRWYEVGAEDLAFSLSFLYFPRYTICNGDGYPDGVRTAQRRGWRISDVVIPGQGLGSVSFVSPCFAVYIPLRGEKTIIENKIKSYLRSVTSVFAVSCCLHTSSNDKTPTIAECISQSVNDQQNIHVCELHISWMRKLSNNVMIWKKHDCAFRDNKWS